MDTTPSQVPVPQVIQCQCSHCRRRWWSPIGALFRFLGMVILIALVFVAGVVVGGSSPTSLPFVQSGGADGDILVPHNGMMLRAGAGVFKLGLGGDDRQFGVITAISGQKVTIADNGGGTQSVLITSDTSVYDGEVEVAMWKLRVGNSIRVFGDDEDGVITAKLVEVIR